jgi:hypothetical protein
VIVGSHDSLPFEVLIPTLILPARLASADALARPDVSGQIRNEKAAPIKNPFGTCPVL